MWFACKCLASVTRVRWRANGKKQGMKRTRPQEGLEFGQNESEEPSKKKRKYDDNLRTNFKELAEKHHFFAEFYEPDKNSIDFSNQKALIALTKALLIENFGVLHWDIPENHLCPPITK